MGGVNHRTASSNRYPQTTSEQRAPWILRYQQSGLTQRAFASEHGIGLSTLGRWLRDRVPTAVEPPALPRLQEVPLSSLLGTLSWAAEITFADGTTVRLTGEVADRLLQPWLLARSGSRPLRPPVSSLPWLRWTCASPLTVCAPGSRSPWARILSRAIFFCSPTEQHLRAGQLLDQPALRGVLHP